MDEVADTNQARLKNVEMQNQREAQAMSATGGKKQMSATGDKSQNAFDFDGFKRRM